MLSKERGMASKEWLEYLSVHQGSAVTIGGSELSDITTELLSLREQLEALKALPPFAVYGNGVYYNTARAAVKDGVAEPLELFTAAKPAEIPRHIYSMLVNELRDVPAIGCKRALIIGVLNRHGVTAEPVGIGMRMLQPHELYAAQGFPKWYIINRDYRGVIYPKVKQIARCGNAVPPQFSESLTLANLPELCAVHKEVAA